MMTSTTTNLNEGYEDGLYDNKAKHPDKDDYMFGYRIGQADRPRRQHHLKGKRMNRHVPVTFAGRK